MAVICAAESSAICSPSTGGRSVGFCFVAVKMGALCARHLDRSVDEPVTAMSMEGISKSQASRLCAEIDERVQTFLHRPIHGGQHRSSARSARHDNRRLVRGDVALQSPRPA